MENLGGTFIYIFVGIGCVIAGFFLNNFLSSKRSKEAQAGATDIRELAKREAETIRKEAELQAKDILIKMRQDFEVQTKERRDELGNSEKRILSREENLDKRVDLLEKKEKDLASRLDALRDGHHAVGAGADRGHHVHGRGDGEQHSGGELCA